MTHAQAAGLAPQPISPDPTAARLSLLLESTGEGIFGVDNTGRCTFINRAGAEMLGRRADDVLGCNMHRLMHHTHPDGRHYPEDECPIFNAFRQGRACRIDREVLWRADGSPFHAEYSSHPVVDAGVVQGAVVTFVDITERRRAEALLLQARADLEQRVDERTAELSTALSRLRDLSAYLETVREDERTRIARDIHDELGSLLVSLKLDVDWMGARLGGRDELAAKCLGMGRRIDGAVETVGRIVTDLRPSILDHQGLWAALEWHAHDVIDRAELAGDVRMHIAAGTEALRGAAGGRWSIAVFRIFQEMLSNVARHARARSLRIRLYADPPPDATLYLEVRDDGRGATAEALGDARSYGVMGMRERAGRFGGSLRIDGAPGQGTTVRLRMPFPRKDVTAGRRAAPSAAEPPRGAANSVSVGAP